MASHEPSKGHPARRPKAQCLPVLQPTSKSFLAVGSLNLSSPVSEPGDTGIASWSGRAPQPMSSLPAVGNSSYLQTKNLLPGLRWMGWGESCLRVWVAEGKDPRMVVRVAAHAEHFTSFFQ